ncbi:hypothetical protein PoB_001495100 [Plakobranchus ocellatus]|uniref:Uncharacterized protein n=1 Tax=Plakobranchus ocellatus TaxID=259542 RepID=A0AAV3YMG7_9GAST|nr:hypothetical protein PoB_001495100 [Plakobranchus ocellatus]
MAPFPLSNRATDVRPGCKTQRITPTLRQVADLVCARIKEREYFKTCIVGHVNCCLQCGPTLKLRYLCPELMCRLRALGALLETGLVSRGTLHLSCLSDSAHWGQQFGLPTVQQPTCLETL